MTVAPDATTKREALARILRERVDGPPEMPLSAGQQMMWFHHELVPESGAYNIGEVLRVRGALDDRVLQRALDALAQRHPMLRTTFHVKEGRPLQRVHAEGQVQLTTTDARDWPRERLDCLLVSNLEAPYDLESLPLMRVQRFITGPDESLLLFGIHHIVSEFWALLLIVRDLSGIYAALLKGTSPDLPHLERRYADFVQAQRQLLRSADGDRLWTYWKQQLADAPRLELPGDRARPPVQTLRGAHGAFILDAELSQNLRKLGHRAGATLYVTMLAIWATQLARYSGQQDLLIGTPFTGRTSAEWADVIGYFDNPLPIRVDMSGNPSLLELVERLKRTVQMAFEHQALPFQTIVERLQPERDASRPPLFNVMLVLRRAQIAQMRSLTTMSAGGQAAGLQFGDSVSLEAYPVKRQVSPLDLSLVLADEGDNLSAYWEYNTDLFQPSTIARFTDHFLSLARRFADDPTCRVHDVSLLDERELERVWFEWNDTETTLPNHGLIHSGFLAHAASHPERTAILDTRRAYTYGWVRSRASRVAGWLRARGAEPEQLVAVVMHKGWEQVVGALGILESGAAYLPIDAGIPEQRIATLLELSGARIVLVQPGGPKLPDAIARLVLDEPTLEELEQPSLTARQTPDQLAYVIFTSGSTGVPKGVMIEHQAALNTLLDINARFKVGPGDSVLAVSSLSFDLSVWDTFGILGAGGTLVLPDASEAPDPAHWAELVKRHGVTIWNTVPSLMQLCANHVNRTDREALRSLRLVMMSGDWIPLRLPAQLETLVPDAKLISLGGATEASIWSILHPIEYVDPEWSSIPYGRPMANQQLFVLDGALEPSPVRVPGDLYIGGIGLARGYFGDEEKTAATFIWHPRTGERLYRTGDLGRYGSDGVIEFLGRKDTQVKIRGFRVELGEIGAVLCRCPGVRRAVIVAQGDKAAKRLVGYVVPDDRTTAPSHTAMRRYLEASLPDYMVPAAFVVLDQLPLTGNGKVDVRALPPPSRERPDMPNAFRAPAPGTEQTLAELFGEVIGISQVGADDGFFALGGDSVQAIMLCASAATRELTVTPGHIFAHPTPAELARVVSAGVSNRPIGLQRASGASHDSVPVSPMQHTMVLHSMYEGSRSLYFEQVRCDLDRPLDAAVLQRAIDRVAEAHPVLRAHFVLDWGSAKLAHSITRQSLPLRELDVRDCPEPELESRLARQLAQDREEGFAVTEGPLLRFTLVRLPLSRQALILSHHHAVLDGWSLSPLLLDLQAAYEMEHAGASEPLPPRGMPFFDYLDWLAWQDPTPQVDFWREELKGIDEPTPLLGNVGAGDAAGTRHMEKDLVLSDAESQILLEGARRSGITLNTLLMGAWALTLGCYAGSQKVVFGVTVSGRPTELPAAMDSVGLFINTVPLAVALPPEERVREWLVDLQRRHQSVSAHDRLPIHVIQEQSEVPDPKRANALFESAVIFENYPVSADLTRPERAFRVRNVRFSEVTGLPITVYGFPGERFGMRIAYDAHRFGAELIDQVLRHLRVALLQSVQCLECSLDKVSLCDDHDRLALARYAGRIGGTEAPSVISEILGQAAVCGSKAAVESSGGTFTYAELLNASWNIAQRLSSMGVMPGQLVAVSLPRSRMQVAALLGALFVGAGYLPIDPEWPEQRLASVVSDAGIRVCLAQAADAPRFDSMGVSVLCADDTSLQLQTEPFPAARAADSDPAYAIYTSGSSGLPKAVVIPRKALATFVHSARHLYGISPSDRVLQFASCTFDASVEEVFLTLASGATLVLRDESMLDSSGSFLQMSAERRITVLDLPTAFWHEVSRDLDQRSLWPELRLVIIGGEAACEPLVRRWIEVAGRGIRLVNTYGPTESTVVATSCDLSQLPLESRKTVPIGVPLAHVRMRIVGPRLRSVPLGVPGELLLGGPALAVGYLNRPDLTARQFVTDPEDSSDRLYRTGDRVRLARDGNLEFLGRMDDQIKVRGFRVELGEIEAVLRNAPGVREGAAKVLERLDGPHSIVGYYVLQEGATAEAVKQHLEAHLPRYMLPSRLVAVPSIPKNSRGKIDRNRLPDPLHNTPPEESMVAETDVEQTISRIWCDVLKLGSVGRHDNFFEIGGDSILAIQIVSRANQAGIPLRPKHLFQHQTIDKLAQIAQALKGYAQDQSPVHGEVTQTPIVRWFLDQHFANPHHWNQALLLQLPHQLVETPLREAAKAVLEHHDMLRLRHGKDGALWIMPPGEPPAVSCRDFALVADADLTVTIEREAEHWQRSLNVHDGPVIRFVAMNLGQERGARLLLVAHHLVVDGVSWRILLEDLLSCYVQASQGTPPSLPPKTASFQAWAAAFQRWTRTEVVHADLDRWVAMLRPGAARLPRDLDGEPNREADAATLTVTLDVDVTRALLQEVPRAYRTQVNDALLAALCLALAEWTGRSETLVDVEGHGREDLSEEVDISRTVGWFTSLYPVPLSIEHGSRVEHVLTHVKEQLRLVPARGMTYGALRWCHPDEGVRRRLSTSPQPEVSFNYLGQMDQAISETQPVRLAPESFGPLHAADCQRRTLLDVNGMVHDGRLVLYWTYSKNHFLESTMKHLSDRYVGHLRSIIEHCLADHAGGFTPSDFPEVGLGQDELNAIVNAFG